MGGPPASPSPPFPPPQDRARRREELKQLKNLKRQELAARIARIRDASGSDAFGLTDSLLQEDFDPTRHDRLMAVGVPVPTPPDPPRLPLIPLLSRQEWFGEEYYGRGEEEKPQFEEEEGLEGEWGVPGGVPGVCPPLLLPVSPCPPHCSCRRLELGRLDGAGRGGAPGGAALRGPRLCGEGDEEEPPTPWNETPPPLE